MAKVVAVVYKKTQTSLINFMSYLNIVLITLSILNLRVAQKISTVNELRIPNDARILVKRAAMEFSQPVHFALWR